MTEKERRSQLRMHKNELVAMYSAASMIGSRALEMFEYDKTIVRAHADLDQAYSDARELGETLSRIIDAIDEELTA